MDEPPDQPGSSDPPVVRRSAWVGESVLLPCVARGYPIPESTWFRGDSSGGSLRQVLHFFFYYFHKNATKPKKVPLFDVPGIFFLDGDLKKKNLFLCLSLAPGASGCAGALPPGGADPAGPAGGGLWLLRVHRQQHGRLSPHPGGADGAQPAGDPGDPAPTDGGPGPPGGVRLRRPRAPGQGDTLVQERKADREGAQVGVIIEHLSDGT